MDTHARMEGGEATTGELLDRLTLKWGLAAPSIEAILQLVSPDMGWIHGGDWLSHHLRRLLHVTIEGGLAVGRDA